MPASRRVQSPSRILAVFCLGLVAACVAAAAGVGLISHFVYGPVAPVRGYIDAIRTGDGGAALGLLGAEVPEGDGAMLSGAALREATRTLSHVHYAVTEASGATATVRASYSLNGADSSTDFTVRRTGTWGGIFPEWTITGQQIPVLEVTSTSTDAATLNRRKVGLAQAGQGTAQKTTSTSGTTAGTAHAQRFPVLWPGVYTAEYSSALLDAEPSTTTVLHGAATGGTGQQAAATGGSGTSSGSEQQAGSLAVDVRPSDQVQASIKSQVRALLDRCAAQDSLYPAGCPFQKDFSGRVQGKVHWSIQAYPDAAASVDSSGAWHLANPKGRARISFTSLDLYTGSTSQVTETIPFTLDARLVVSGDQVTVVEQ